MRSFIPFCVLVLAINFPDTAPKHVVPTKGEVWPKAQKERKDFVYFTFDPSDFRVNVTGYNCSMLARAISRYSYVYASLMKIVQKYKTNVSRESPGTYSKNYRGNMQELTIELTAPCEDYPYLNMDEKYNLVVDTTSNLRSGSIWGIIRGLETFAQVVYVADDYSELRLNKTSIVDFPRYPHRGLLLDTARHFISLGNIFITLDAMAMNKMNVFHWHLVDDQSFPYQSEQFPGLSERGAYHPTMVYTKSDVQRVINYARDRGIRVVPEFDVPGHTASWGEAFPQLLTECYTNNTVTDLGPMNPISNMTYKFLQDLFQEVQGVFPDKYLHVGGDEVALDCWESNPELQKYMQQHHMTDVKEFHELFMSKIIPFLSNNREPIVWQEVFDEDVPLPPATIVQVWKTDNDVLDMIRILVSGFRVLFSAPWYLDHLDATFSTLYNVDPRKLVHDCTHNATILTNIVGGEACMWAEMVDDRNMLSRVWPRASAVAERLWSPLPAKKKRRRSVHRRIPADVFHRIEEHACRMIRRGVPSEPPTGPGFCLA